MVTPKLNLDGMVHMPLDDFEHLLEQAAERGARKAMADVGLDGEHAADDIRALRGLLEAFNTAKRTVWQTIVKMATTALIIALVTGAAMHFKLFGSK
jgi:Family of unknown function (DUF6127)